VDLLLASVGAMTWSKAFGAQVVSGRIGWATQTLGGTLTLAQVESDAQWCAIPAGGVVTVLDIVLSLLFLRFLRWWLVGPGCCFWWRLWRLDHLTGAVA